MAKTLGYMLTWTTYGTWLQGDERGYVKHGKVLPGAAKLLEVNKKAQTRDMVRFSARQKNVVHDAILREADALGQRVLALVVCSNHVHFVVEYIPKPVGRVVAYYKKAGRLALKKHGLNGRVWTTGYDKRFCFDEESLGQRVEYVQRHGQ